LFSSREKEERLLVRDESDERRKEAKLQDQVLNQSSLSLSKREQDPSLSDEKGKPEDSSPRTTQTRDLCLLIQTRGDNVPSWSTTQEYTGKKKKKNRPRKRDAREATRLMKDGNGRLTKLSRNEEPPD
jgi:hypothetical protein